MSRLKDEIIGVCKKCEGKGIIYGATPGQGEKCSCKKIYETLVPLFHGGFPYEDLILIAEGKVNEMFEVVDERGYFSRASDYSKNFIMNGAGLVLVGSGANRAATTLVAKMSEANKPLLVGFNTIPYDAEVLVLTTERGPDELVRFIECRVKSLKPTIFCTERMKDVEQQWALLDALGWDGKDFSGPVFRSVSVQGKIYNDRWDRVK